MTLASTLIVLALSPMILAKSIGGVGSPCSKTGFQCGDNQGCNSNGYCQPAPIPSSTSLFIPGNCTNFGHPCNGTGLCVKNSDSTGRCIASGPGISLFQQKCDGIENVCAHGLQCVNSQCQGKTVGTGSDCSFSGPTVQAVCKDSDICIYPTFATVDPTVFSGSFVNGICIPAPPVLPSLPQSLSIQSCVPDLHGTCLGLPLCFKKKDEVQNVYSCSGHLLQVNASVIAVDAISNTLSIPTANTGELCDNLPLTITRCNPADICLYVAAPSKSTSLSAVCTPQPPNLPLQITTTNSNNPTCIPDPNGICHGLWICFIGNNGVEAVYYCDGESQTLNGVAKYVGWIHAAGPIPPAAKINGAGDGGSNIGLIVGSAIAAVLIVGGVAFAVHAKRFKNKNGEVDDMREYPFSGLGATNAKHVNSKVHHNQEQAAVPLYADSARSIVESVDSATVVDASMASTRSGAGVVETVVDVDATVVDAAPSSPVAVAAADIVPPSATAINAAITMKARFSKLESTVRSVPGFYKTLNNHVASTEYELSFEKDVRVYVTSKPDMEGWCHALIAGDSGLVHHTQLGTIG
ncbi:UNVERIFIED_CONTAM: hypothetical protein HDU68_010167 [Siphonaria sp. JEL0065]|nr:hypothetical protein HDU68_010167 [Siphonaria sp. JEL0065]